MIRRILFGMLIVGALAAALVYSKLRVEPFRVSGFIEADEIRVGSGVGGRVTAVRVEEGQRVKRGDLLPDVAGLAICSVVILSMSLARFRKQLT